MKKKSLGLSVLLTGMGALFLALTGIVEEKNNLIIQVALVWAICVGTYAFLNDTDCKAKLCFGTVGSGIVFATSIGRRLSVFDRTGWDGLILCALAALCWGGGVGAYLLRLCRWLEKRSPDQKNCRVFLRSFLFIICGWLPIWLACFPCIFGYDLGSQLHQILSGNYTTHHPLLHTLLIGGLYKFGGVLGNFTLGAFLYALIQVICLAASMAYALSYLAKLRCPRGVRITLMAFFALAPNHSVLAIGTTKDVFFASFAIVAMIEIHKAFLCRERLKKARTVVMLVLPISGMCLMRNNAMMAIAAWIIPAVGLIGRKYRRRMVAVVMMVLLLQSAISFGLQNATQASDGLINEMLSVPAQQIARMHVSSGEGAGSEALEWVPHAEKYQPSRADNVKLHLKVQREGELLGFLKFWIREFFSHPIEYIDAFLLNANGYWNPQDTSFSSVYGQWPDGTVGALIIEQYEGYGVTFTSLLPGLRKLYDWLFSQNNYQRVPGLSTLIHPATYTWMLLFVLAWAIWRRRWAVLGSGTLMLMYLLTLFLGPCTLVRYCYYLMTAAPVLLALMCTPKENA